MVSIKRIIALIATLIMVVGLIGCGKKPAETNATQDKPKLSAETTDANGNKLSDTQRADIATFEEVEKAITQYQEITCNFTTQTADDMLKNMKSKVTSEWYAEWQKYIESDVKKANYSIKLVNATVTKQNADIEGIYEGKTYKDGNAVYTETEVEYIENGKTVKETVINNAILKDGAWIITGEKVKQ